MVKYRIKIRIHDFLTGRGNALLIGIILLFFALAMIPYKKEGERGKPVFTVYSKDSIPWQIDLICDSAGVPDSYYSDLKTPVCEDSLCRVVFIDLYWDVLGNFMKYEVPPDMPLTKFDHLEFTPEDYQKLNEILADKQSLLGRYKAEDLIDKNTKRVSETVDAVTGATKTTVPKCRSQRGGL